MKIYVDVELPKSCAECKILGVFDWCNYLKDCVSDEIKNNKRHVLCPLETTQSLKQQVREEVVEEIKKISDSILARYENRELDDVAYGELVCCNMIIKKLDQEKGENMVEKDGE